MKVNAFYDGQKPQSEENYADTHENRQDDRRKEASVGFAYISMVGWIDRREKSRRKDDNHII